MAKQGRANRRDSSTERTLSKVAAGITGLDDILEGGLPAGRTTLISGGPGTGKTMPGSGARRLMHNQFATASLEAAAYARQGGRRI
jgi:hypothetical protein